MFDEMKSTVEYFGLRIGLVRPRNNILGMDASGIVESTGSKVTEYVAVSQESAIVLKPANMSFEQAAAIPFGGLPALVALKRANVKPGDTVLINGASGALGTAAVQLARHFGAHVTAVCSSGNVELVESLGADMSIDYKARDFTTEQTRYDVIMDCVGNAPFERVENVIRPGGSLLLVIFDLKGALFAPLRQRRTGKKVTLIGSNHTAEALPFLVNLAASRQYK